MKKTIYILILLILPLVTKAEKVKVRIFSQARIECVYVSFDLGTYNLYSNDTNILEKNLGEGMSVEVKSTPTGVHVAINGYEYGIFRNVRFEATDTACIMCINPKGTTQRTYEGDLTITAINSTALKLINDVEFETYLAGVVQSEIYGTHSDIFRIQAIISRTWALRNMNKHKSEGYNFCDHVHCQAYLNRCVRPDIMLGTMLSAGETIVDEDEHLIDTPFHSNSGGQTANSEEVWRSVVPYLRSVPDTFSYQMKQSKWEKTFTQEKWLNYFAKTHKLDIQNDSIRAELLSFSQPERKSKIAGVPLTRVRVDFQLKSTFFDVSTQGSNVVIHGRGYGHGVGLSQEGTIRMVGLGYDYDYIIKHYYTGAHIHKSDISQNYVQGYIKAIEKIIEDDKNKSSQVKSKKDDWLGQLFRIRDREEREEVFDEKKVDIEKDWEYDW